MVSEKKKINRVINFLKKGLSGLADELEGTVKGINDFLDSLSKAQKDLKEVPVEAEIQTVTTSSKKIIFSRSVDAKAKAANTLFTLLSGTPGRAKAAPPSASKAAAPIGTPQPPGIVGPPKRIGPPKAPPKVAAPSKPSSELPSSTRLPPLQSISAPPKAPTIPSTPAGPPTGPPAAPPAKAATVASAGGSLSTLRDEMLEELTRLKKIMRGE